MKKWFSVLFIIAVITGTLYLYQQKNSQHLPEHIVQSNGRLELERFDVASLYGGRVEKVLVEEGGSVQAGEVLVELSSVTASSHLAEAQAGVMQGNEAVERARAGEKQAREAIARAQAQISAQQQQLKLAQMEWDNAIKLQKENLISAAETQRRRSQRDSAAAAVKAVQAAKAEAQAAAEQAKVGIAEAQAGVMRAQAQVKAAQSADDEMSIRTPKAGRVEYRLVEEGNVIGAGSKVVSILDPSKVSMNIFLPTQVVSKLRVGDEARIVLDGMDAVIPARISFIASDAQFTPKAVETANERAKLMFKVKLNVPSETALQYKGLLKGGMAGNGFVRTDSQQAWSPELAVTQAPSFSDGIKRDAMPSEMDLKQEGN